MRPIRQFFCACIAAALLSSVCGLHAAAETEMLPAENAAAEEITEMPADLLPESRAAIAEPVASDAHAADGAAAEYTKSAVMTASSGYNPDRLRDGNESTTFSFSAGKTLTIKADGEIAGLYVKFEKNAYPWEAVSDTLTLSCGQSGFLHEYADVSELHSDTVTMRFTASYTTVSELRVFGPGTLPDDVQVWQPPYEKADMALFTTHSDDEQLFFLGLIPYAAAHGIKLQVIYFTHHNGEPIRLHEQLNGLWAAGATHYPEIGIFPDQYSETLQAAKNNFSYAGFSYNTVLAHQIEMLRKYRPDVVVGHDLSGEYGHGQHRLNADTLTKAVEQAGIASNDPASAQKYGVWDVPKTYLHLYGKNQLVMNYDEPLDYFGGQTAYQMSRKGYTCHNSQQYTWFTKWGYGPKNAPFSKASQISTYSPCLFGLYRTTVGPDSGINDMFEHVQAEPLRGDVNSNGAVEADDAQSVLQEYVRMLAEHPAQLTAVQTLCADVDMDGAVTAADAQLILKYYVKNVLSAIPTRWDQLLHRG